MSMPFGTRISVVIGALALACASPGNVSPSASAPTSGGVATDVVRPAFEEHDFDFGQYTFRDGEVLPSLRIHYATLGTPHRDQAGNVDNAVLVLHWTSASSEAVRSDEYVRSLYGAGQPLDPATHFLIFVDNVGHGRSSKPSDGLHARFPHYGYRDMVDIQHRLVSEVLGIRRLRAIFGMSMGGMHAWLWAENHPGEVEAIMPVVALPTRIAGRNLVWRRIVTRAIRTDPDWQNGDYREPPRGWTEAFPLFRMMLDGVPHLQATIPDRTSADAFVRAAVDQAKRMDANDVLYSLESSEDYDPEADLGKIRARVLALNFSDDEFNPVELGTLDRLVGRVPGAKFVIQPGTETSHGHLTQAHPALWANHVATFMHDVDGAHATQPGAQ